jgi:hypothetical protein
VLRDGLAAFLQAHPEFKPPLAPCLETGPGGHALSEDLAKLAATLGEPAPRTFVHALLLEAEARAAEISVLKLEADGKHLRDWRNFTAKSIYEKLVAAQPDSVEGFFDLAQVDGELRQTHNAINAFSQVLQIDPLHREAAIGVERAGLALNPSVTILANAFNQSGRQGALLRVEGKTLVQGQGFLVSAPGTEHARQFLARRWLHRFEGDGPVQHLLTQFGLLEAVQHPGEARQEHDVLAVVGGPLGDRPDQFGVRVRQHWRHGRRVHESAPPFLAGGNLLQQAPVRVEGRGAFAGPQLQVREPGPPVQRLRRHLTHFRQEFSCPGEILSRQGHLNQVEPGVVVQGVAVQEGPGDPFDGVVVLLVQVDVYQQGAHLGRGLQPVEVAEGVGGAAGVQQEADVALAEFLGLRFRVEEAPHQFGGLIVHLQALTDPGQAPEVLMVLGQPAFRDAADDLFHQGLVDLFDRRHAGSGVDETALHGSHLRAQSRAFISSHRRTSARQLTAEAPPRIVTTHRLPTARGS